MTDKAEPEVSRFLRANFFLGHQCDGPNPRYARLSARAMRACRPALCALVGPRYARLSEIHRQARGRPHKAQRALGRGFRTEDQRGIEEVAMYYPTARRNTLRSPMVLVVPLDFQENAQIGKHAGLRQYEASESIH